LFGLLSYCAGPLLVRTQVHDWWNGGLVVDWWWNGGGLVVDWWTDGLVDWWTGELVDWWSLRNGGSLNVILQGAGNYCHSPV
jgi:hypothetical protein